MAEPCPKSVPTNNSIFGFSGVIGRLAYLKNLAVLTALALPGGFMLLGAMRAHFSQDATILLLAGIALSLPLVPFQIGNNYRRMKDMHGRVGFGTFMRVVALMVAIPIPVLGIIALAIMILKAGVYTSGASPDAIADLRVGLTNAVSTVKSSVSQIRTAEAPENRLAKLHSLRQQGAITEQEYEVSKKELLKKIA